VNERIREYKIRIDELYQSAYGRTIAGSQEPEVIQLRDSLKREVLLKGMQPNIRELLWNTLKTTDTYQMTVEKAQDIKQIIQLRQITEKLNEVKIPKERTGTPTQTDAYSSW
jgi:hypothetical protein